MNKKKGVVYTCITGDYDQLIDHDHVNLDWDYVCFTDSVENYEGNVLWQIRKLEFSELDDIRNARWHKLHPHILFPEYKNSIWIDANINVINSSFFSDVNRIIDNNEKMASAVHPSRNCIYDELKECIRLGKDDVKTMKRQMEIIKKDGFPQKHGLFETNVIYRNHNDVDIKKVMIDWWWWIANYSRRDQLSLTYVLWKKGVDINFLSDIAYKKSNKIKILKSINHVTKEELLLQQKELQKTINRKDLKIRDLEKAINFMSSSKFWKIRNFYLYLQDIIKKTNISLNKKEKENTSTKKDIFEDSFFVDKKAPLDKVDIVLVRFNNKDVEDKAIEYVKKNTRHPYKLTVYDNYEKNEGLSTVWNKIIEKSNCKYICLLNSDAFVTEGWLDGMMRGFVHDSDVVAISPSSNDAKGQIIDKDKIRKKIFKEMDTLSGFCLLVKKDVSFKFPEEVPFYGGEHAWCIEAKRRGKKLLWAQGVWVEHLGGASAKKEGNEDQLWSQRNYNFYKWLAKTTPVLFTTYNRLDYTRKTLPKLLDSDCGTVIVVDNYSTDGTREYLESMKNPKLKIIFKEENTGIAGSMNTFFDLTENEEFVAKVDNDTIVPKDWLIKMIEHVSSYNIDAMQAKHSILSEKYGSFDEWLSDLDKIGDNVYESGHIGGSGVVIKRSSIKGSLNNSKWVLGGWDQYQKDNPDLRVAFCDNVEIELLDMKRDNEFDYHKYSDYYKKTGRKKDFIKEVKELQTIIQKQNEELNFVKSSKFWKIRNFYLNVKNGVCGKLITWKKRFFPKAWF